MSYCGTFRPLDLIPVDLIPLDFIPLDLIPLDLILKVISFRSYSIRSYSNLTIRSYSIRSYSCLPNQLCSELSHYFSEMMQRKSVILRADSVLFRINQSQFDGAE